jgi:hypothetical protein
MRLRQEVQALPRGTAGNVALSCCILEAWTTAYLCGSFNFLAIRGVSAAWCSKPASNGAAIRIRVPHRLTGMRGHERGLNG